MATDRARWKWRLGDWAITALMIVPVGMLAGIFIWGVILAAMGKN